MNNKSQKTSQTEDFVFSVDIRKLYEELTIVPQAAFTPLTEIVLQNWLRQLPDTEITDAKSVPTYRIDGGPLVNYYVVADGTLIRVNLGYYTGKRSFVDFRGRRESPLQISANNFSERVRDLKPKKLIKEAKEQFRHMGENVLARYGLLNDEISEAKKFYELIDAPY